MDFKSFSHGQIHSKLWLCEKLEPFIPNQSVVAILGSWYNVLGFMLLTRDQSKYKFLEGIDIDPVATEISNNLCSAWGIGYNHIVTNINADANLFNLDKYNIIINCSPEHMNKQDWFRNLKDQIICLQTTDVISDDPIWDITNPIQNMEEFKKKYPMSQILFEGEKVFDYGTLRYKRFMLIGKK